MQDSFEDLRAFLGVATAGEAANCLLSGPKKKVKATLFAYNSHMTERGTPGRDR